MRQKVLAIGIAFILVATASLSVVAQGNGNQNDKPKTAEELVQQRMDAREQAREQLSAERQARIQQRCQGAQEKIQGVADRLGQFQTNHSGIYNSWFTRLASLLDKLEANPEVDTSQLRTDIEALDALITELQASFDDYETEITTLLNMNCAENAQEFHNALLAARDLRQVVIDAMQSVREHIRTTIKVDLKAIKKQLNTNQDDGTAEGSQ